LYRYQLATSGNGQQAIQDVQNLLNNAEQQMQTALNDVDGAIKYIIDGEKQHPNRIDTCAAKGGAITQMQSTSGFQQPTSTFGQPSTFGHPSIISTSSQPASSTFDRPAATFGQPSAHDSAFGQPSSLVQQPSTFGQESGFGQQSQLGRPSTSFGQPTSTFGQPSSSTPAFGQPAAPSVFGQSQQQPSAFDVPSALGTNQQNSAFSQPANPFGAPSALPQQGVFGQPSLPAAPNPFAQAPAAPSSWGQPTSTSAPPPGSSFGQPATVQPSPFRQAPTSQSADPTTNTTFGNPNSTSASSGSQNHAQQNAQGKLVAWKGKPVTYVNDEPCFKRNDGALEKVWFPDGPPPFKKDPGLPDEAYDEATTETYMYMKEHGAFKGGIMPELPPKREWVHWDF
jgi:nucleoporin NUP42